MDIDETATGVDTTNNPGADTEWVAHATTFYNMAPDMEANSAMDTDKRSLLPNTNTSRADLTRLFGLYAVNQMEHVPEEQP